jgi:hypothetical protein
LAAEHALTYRALEERKVDLVIARIFHPIAEEHMHAQVLYDEQDVVAAGAQIRGSGGARSRLPI